MKKTNHFIYRAICEHSKLTVVKLRLTIIEMKASSIIETILYVDCKIKYFVLD